MGVTPPRIAVVIPTLGQRPDLLRRSLESLRAAGEAHLILVAPAALDASDLIAAGLLDEKLDETGRTPAGAINQGFAAAPATADYLAWLGDDDVLRPGALTRTSAFLDQHPKSSAVYGSCEYIDEQDRVVWKNRSGRWAAWILRFGPDLIPQPGSLFRRSSLEKVGELRSDLGWAFDFDLFIRLQKVGRLSFIPEVLAGFRWHPGSLSVGQRRRSVEDASRVRVSHLPKALRPISVIWEAPVRWVTFRAAGLVKDENGEHGQA